MESLPISDKAGYIYVLINPSATGIVKIGKTQRNPEERAKELSSATGVPTPFMVIYEAFFRDCSAAELFIHTLLKDRRLSDNKEFFRVSPSEAVQAVIEAEKALADNSEIDESNYSETYPPSKQESQSDICEEIMNSAEAHYHGLGDVLRDYEQALDLYKQAAKLGCKEAFYNIGEMYYAGVGVRKDLKQALNYYKEGAGQGDDKCWGNMAVCYFELGQFDNSDKCWLRLIDSPSLKGKESEMGYYYYMFYQNMKVTRSLKHPDILESLYQEIKEGIEKSSEAEKPKIEKPSRSSTETTLMILLTVLFVLVLCLAYSTFIR